VILPPGAATGCSGCRSRQHMQVVQLGPPHAIADVQRPAGRPGDLVSGPLVGYVLRPVGVLCRSRPLVRPGPRPPDQLRTRTRQFALTAESACRRSRSSCKATNPQNAARCFSPSRVDLQKGPHLEPLRPVTNEVQEFASFAEKKGQVVSLSSTEGHPQRVGAGSATSNAQDSGVVLQILHGSCAAQM
jgi:hypothetical protein